MYILIVGFSNGDFQHIGPFKTKQRVLGYAEAYFKEERRISQIVLAALTQPYNS